MNRISVFKDGSDLQDDPTVPTARCICIYEWRPLEGFHRTATGFAVDWVRIEDASCRVHKRE